MTNVHDRLSTELEIVRESISQYYNKTRRSIEVFKSGELVILNRKNVRSKGRCKKLDDKMYRPFEILWTGHNNQDSKLELPGSSKIHRPFIITLFERYEGKNPEKSVIKVEAYDAGWGMEKITASGRSNCNL